jgi:hypothetical protein
MAKRHFSGPISQYPDNFLECRAFGHQWRFVTDARIVWERGGVLAKFVRQVQCINCTGERDIQIGPTMRSVGNTYRRPEGYSTTGPQRLDVAGARAEFLRRMTES